jgi:DNA polymerase III gamma/tau subunit
VAVLHLKYRPKTFDAVIGQNGAVASLRRTIADGRSQAFLFTGPSGCGKTTLARIVAQEVGCHGRNILEVDAATHTGIDAMRQVAETTTYHGIGGGSKMVIVDEAHALSAQAWKSLLKAVEEPPQGVYWAFCTTEPAKIPRMILTRCSTYTLNEVDTDDLAGLLESIAEKEKLKVKGDVLYLAAESADGSPRQALNLLALLAPCKGRKEALKLLRQAETEEGPAVDLARALVKGTLTTWPKAMKIISQLKGTQPESVRIVVMAYLATVLMGQKTDDRAVRLLEIMNAFSKPYPRANDLSPLLLSIGEVMYGEEEE